MGCGHPRLLQAFERVACLHRRELAGIAHQNHAGLLRLGLVHQGQRIFGTQEARFIDDPHFRLMEIRRGGWSTEQCGHRCHRLNLG